MANIDIVQIKSTWKNKGSNHLKQLILNLEIRTEILEIAQKQIDTVKLNNLESLRKITLISHNELLAIDEIRESTKYKTDLKTFNPSFSIIIPTHTNPPELWSRTMRSILNLEGIDFEVIVVCENEQLIESLTVPKEFNSMDLKIIKNRFLHSEESIISSKSSETTNRLKWFNSGTGGFLSGINSSKYAWVIPMAHDDEFPNSLSVRKMYEELFYSKDEIALGRIEQLFPDGLSTKSYSNNPLIQSNYGIQGSIIYQPFARYLFKFIDNYFEIPNDWGVIERIRSYNLRLKICTEIMSNYYPSKLWVKET